MSGYGFASKGGTGGGGGIGGWQSVSTIDEDTTNNTKLQSEMTESLFGYPKPGDVVPIATATQCITVVAPATLPEGYQFDTIINNNTGATIKVTVPPGGIEKGQTFSVPMTSTTTIKNVTPASQVLSSSSNINNNGQQQQQSATGSNTGSISIPVGHWRDEIFACFNYGLCHPHWWTSLLCPLLAVGQVITRLQLKWNGQPAMNQTESRNAFTILLIITGIHFFSIVTLYIAVLTLDPNDYSKDIPDYLRQPLPPLEQCIIILYNLLRYLYLIIAAFWLYKVRQVVRAKYAIRGDNVSDCCLSCFCHCCTASQLLRHTTDYDIYPSQVCTSSGLSPNVPSIV